ncbi:prepronociceptin [Monodelphis domestica]|uniref:Prepronociceptin n=1 Tax=Monodelphis domestica TaxID=13616 RepID=F6PGA1_MONDO|nr:prepronociceptin [Monodelphis domestica]
MKTLLCDLLLLGLFSNVFSDCQKDCLTCREKLHPFLDNFSVDECITDCEGQVFLSPFWAPCTKAMNKGPWQLSLASKDEAMASVYQPQVMEVQGLSQMEPKNRVSRVRSLYQAQEEEAAEGLGEAGEEMQKKLQKRFGGFTGARKSARKLANQKRFSEFMRQYLVMSMHASEHQRHGLAPGRNLRQNSNV